MFENLVSAESDDDVVEFDEQGQSAVLVLVVVLVLGIALLSAIVDFGGVTQDRARAQTAADAAALASVDGDAVAATEYAEAHGGIVVSWQRGPGEHEVTVVVRVGDAVASARATKAP